MRASASDVSREWSTSFSCMNVNQSVNCWREKHDDFSHFSCAPRAIVEGAENDFHQNVYEFSSVTQMNLFVYSAVCSQQY